MENKKTLEVGTKYLSCMMDTAVALKLVLEAVASGKDKVSFAAFKDDTKEVAAGFECGIDVENFNDIKVNDILESYKIIEIKRKI